MELASLINRELPFVIYKKPGSGKLHIIQQKSDKLHTGKDFQSDGFYFAPYDLDKHPVVVFPKNESKKDSFFLREFSNRKTGKIKLENLEPVEKEAEIHQNKVAQAIEHIRQGEVKKVIISRKQEISYEQFDIFQAVLELMHHYENSFVYLWHHPKVGTWMGASPELLFEQKEEQFQTMALAGTLPVHKNEPVSWQIKEINEQQIVTDYITNKLKKYSNKVKTGQPQTLYQGNLAHIKTEIHAVIDPEKINQILFALHPTPAVCGLPVEKAKKIIDKIELYDRKYYTGFLGEKSNEQSCFYVNLRSMEVFLKKINIYVGGGIIIDSNIKKEWIETTEKSKILLSIFNNNITNN